MKSIFIMFLAMLTVFAGVWVYKANFSEPVNARSGDGPAWWEDSGDAWVGNTLDPEIPENYIPVLGRDELYMVLDDDGNIVGYRQRTKQEDGSWVWEDVNPDIPEGWESVPGLDNVFKATDEDGNVRYYKYTRNDDNTFYFTEVDENGRPLALANPDGNVIPSNYVRITGNIYAVYNEHGVIIGYKERIQNPDGTYSWRDVERPEKTDPAYNPQTKRDGDGGETAQTEKTEGGIWEIKFPTGQTSTAVGDVYVIVDGPASPNIKQTPADEGGYVETESYTESKTKDGYAYVYETTVTRKYDKDGKLMSTKKEGPTEISKYPASLGVDVPAPDPSRAEESLSDEHARVTSGIDFATDLESEVLAALNASRAEAGLSPLSKAGGDLGKAARLKAADMAIYDHSSYDSPMYGNLETMLAGFGIIAKNPSEVVWKTENKPASQIHERLATLNEGARMSELYAEVGIAIAKKNGYIYIAEVYN